MRLSTVIFLIHPKSDLLLIANSIHKVQSILNKQVIRQWSKKSKHSHEDKSVSTVENQGQSILNQHFKILWLIVLNCGLVSCIRDIIPATTAAAKSSSHNKRTAFPSGPQEQVGSRYARNRSHRTCKRTGAPRWAVKFCHMHL